MTKLMRFFPWNEVATNHVVVVAVAFAVAVAVVIDAIFLAAVESFFASFDSFFYHAFEEYC